VNTPRPAARTAGAARTARESYDRAVDVLDRLVPLAGRLERTVRVYGITVLLAALITVGSVLVVDLPSEVWTWGLLLVVFAALLVAPIVILLFASMLREALELPERFRSLPEVAPGRARQLGELVVEARRRPQGERLGAMPRDTWRAGRLLNRLRKDVPGVSVLLALARVPFMVLVAVSLLVGAVEIAFAPLFLTFAVVTTLV
jgi:hypothetical protein